VIVQKRSRVKSCDHMRTIAATDDDLRKRLREPCVHGARFVVVGGR
jgi:hypothetical protein